VGVERGSGFAIEAWDDCVITARHVVERPPAVDESRMNVIVECTDKDGHLVGVDVRRCAYLEDERWDLAVLWLGDLVIPKRFAVATSRPVDESDFAAEVRGFPAGDAGDVIETFTAHRSGSLLSYLNHRGRLGVSGGPLLFLGQALGVQSSDIGGSGRATLLAFRGVLDECRLRARNAA
jgi:hypothetical protein